MTQVIDNSELYYLGTTENIALNVGASTTLKKGTILGRDKTSAKIVAYDSTNCTNLEMYILAEDVTNSAAAAADIQCTVLSTGEVNRFKLVLADASELTSEIMAKLRANGFILQAVWEQTKKDVL